MASKTLREAQFMPGYWLEEQGDEIEGCSVGIMAHNEEANIARTIWAVLDQRGPSIHINEVIVVASGCTDRTVPIVLEMAQQEPRLRLYIQEKREGKASAINVFLKEAIGSIVVLIGADVIPESSALEYLCSPFNDPKIGMVGGRPVPVNNPATFMGHAVHLLWRLHDRMARIHPKLGEVIAFRNVILGIPSDSAVDEISIQALISQLGYELLYQPDCIVYNKGPLTVRDFLKQRRRIYAGHLRVRDQQNYEAATMRVGSIVRQLIASRAFTMSTPRRIVWTMGAVFLEGLARMQGYYDYRSKREHHIWQMVGTTKTLEGDSYKLRHICNTQSVLVFRFILESTEKDDIDPESGAREATIVARKLLPIVRARVRKEDKLSLNGSGIMTAVIRADHHGSELVARRIQETVSATTVRIGIRSQEVKVRLAYSSLTFATSSGNLTSSSLARNIQI